ncbi:MAG: hypothetical protein AAF823_07400 [Planctomycetota bacterium]
MRFGDEIKQASRAAKPVFAFVLLLISFAGLGCQSVWVRVENVVPEIATGEILQFQYGDEVLPIFQGKVGRFSMSQYLVHGPYWRTAVIDWVDASGETRREIIDTRELNAPWSFEGHVVFQFHPTAGTLETVLIERVRRQ